MGAALKTCPNRPTLKGGDALQMGAARQLGHLMQPANQRARKRCDGPRDVDLDAQRGGSSRSIPLGRRRHPFDSQRQPADRDRALAWSVSCGRSLSGLFWQSVVYGYYWQGIA